jgi:hypothetical protein
VIVMRRLASVLALLFVTSGCGGALVRLAKDQNWDELDRQARAQKRTPRGKAARAWAQALVELDKVEEARAVLLRDFRHGGQEASLLALADLELRLGLRGIAAAHYTRLIDIDLDTVKRSPKVEAVCELLRERARVEAELGEALAADLDMRRLALTCPTRITDEDRGFMASLRPLAQAQARGQRTLDASITPSPDAITIVQSQLDQQLELARKRSPRAMIAFAEAERIELEPEDIAGLLAAEFAGALGPGLITPRRLSAWVGDNDVAAVLVAVDGLPDGVREYALLRLASVRSSDRLAGEQQTWIVAAMDAVAGQGPQEAAKAWRVAASVGDLGGAEFALNTNLRDMIPTAEPSADGAVIKPSSHWSRRVPVERRSFDLLLTLARLLELRDQPVLALELRRSVIVAGYEVGLVQVGPAAAEEVLRLLALGRPWQALAVAEVVPGPLIDEVLPAVAASVALARAAKLDEAIATDRNVVWRALGDSWLESWDPRVDAATGGLELRELTTNPRCPELAQWLVPEQVGPLARVGLDPEASKLALEAALAQPQAPETGVALARAIESDLGLACSAPLVNLLHAGLHLLALETLDDRLAHAPELSASAQLQLQAEIAAAYGATGRATLLTISAAAESVDPRSMWARAAVAGRSFGAREYTLEALRQVILHSSGLDDAAARRELLLIRLRDVDSDAILRDGDRKAIEAVREAIRSYLVEAPDSRRWSRLDDLLGALAREPRADATAWARLLEILEPILDDRTSAWHRASIEALTRAASEDPAKDPAKDQGTLTLRPELAALGDADAICELAGSASEPQRLLGSAIACGPRARAEALAALVEASPTDARANLRALILAGPIAAEVDPDRPGVVHSVPALAREGLSLRVAFNLPLDPVWIITESQR